MIHEGDNTYCGHYYDLVRHPFTGTWYKYNDEVGGFQFSFALFFPFTRTTLLNIQAAS